MGFLRSTKGSIISDYFQLQEDIAGFSKGYMYDVALYDDHLEITSMQKRKLLLNYDQITDVFYGGKTELIQKPKSVIGRAVVGGVIFGGVGAVVGAASGTGTKTGKKTHLYFIISYTSSDGEDKYIQFEDTRMYKGLKLSKKTERTRTYRIKHLQVTFNFNGYGWLRLHLKSISYIFYFFILYFFYSYKRYIKNL